MTSTDAVLPDPEVQPTVPITVAARALGIGRDTAYRAAHSGDLPTIRIGGRFCVPTAALRRMLELDAGGTEAAEG